MSASKFIKGCASAACAVVLATAGQAMAQEQNTSRNIAFDESSGFGVNDSVVMIEDIRVDTVISNPFDESRPEIVSRFFNVPFEFNPQTLHLVPNLSAATNTDDESQQCADFTANVNSAASGTPIQGATVLVRNRSATTNSDGQAEFEDLLAGDASVEVSAPEFVATEQSVSLTCERPVNIGLALNPEGGSDVGGIDANEVRVVLSWGEAPRDLDSHMTGPTGTGDRFHTYFASRSDQQSELDVDDVTSFGPETITLSPRPGAARLVPGIYRYSVHHFSGSSTIADSPARVRLVFGGTNQERTFTVPAAQRSNQNGDDDLWTVFELNVAQDGSITVLPVQTIENDFSSFEVTSGTNGGGTQPTHTGYGAVETGIDFSSLPEK